MPITRRLPLLIGLLLLIVFAASGLVAYRAVKQTVVEASRDRLVTLTTYLANQFQQQSVIMGNRTAASANEAAIRNFLESQSARSREEALAALRLLAPSQDQSHKRVELWSRSSQTVLTIPEGADPLANLDQEFKDSAVQPFKVIGAIRIIDDAPVYPVVAATRDAGGNPIGYLVRWRKLSSTPEARKQLTDIVGNQAVLYMGNARGDVWTDMGKAAQRPPIDLAALSEVANYARDAEQMMATGRPINGTPWFLVIEFPMQPLQTQANQFLRRIILADLAFLVIGLVGSILLARSLTKPLRSLTQAAAALSAGEHKEIADANRTDELGVLAQTFNAMAIKVRTSQRDLERKVRDRTAQLEAAAGAILMVDEKGLIAMANRKAEVLFKYEPGELVGQPIEMLVPERYRALHPNHRAGFFHSPATRAMGAGRDLFGRRKDGSEVPIEIGLNPVRTEDGPFVLASIIDITERTRAEERFRLVVEASPSAIIMVNNEGRITLVNAQTEKFFGYTRAELLHQPIEMLVPERFRSAHPGHRENFFHRPSSRPMGAGRDLFGLRKDGREVPIEIGLNPLHTEEGAFVLASIIDITERKRAEERFRQVIERAPNGMVMVDQSGKIVLVNVQIERSFGYDRDELLGKPIELLVPKRFHGRHTGYRDDFMGNPTARRMGAGRDLFGLRKDGTEFPVEIGLNPLHTEQGLMVLGTIVDITERKLAEQEVRQSKERLAGIIGSAMDAIISVDDEHRIVLFNNAAERMFLFPAEDAIGQPLDRFIPQRFREAHQQHIRKFGETQVTRRSMGALGDLFGLRADGEEFPIEASISQVETDGRRVYTVILRDITERKTAEESLKEHARILDLAPVIIRDLNGRVLFWNKGSEQMYGWSAEQALDNIIHNLLQTEFPRPLEEIKARLLANGQWEGELVQRRRDGSRIVVYSHWALHRDELGKPKAVVVVNNDITERKEAEERSTKLATAVEQSGDSIIITDTEGNITYVNPAFEQITGYSSAEVMGQNPRLLKGGKANGDYYQNLWQTITSGTQWTGQFTNKRKDGSLFEEEATISPVRDSAGNIVSYVAVKRDITERMRAEAEIRELNEELEQRVADRTAQLQAANKELEAFSYSVSHDLRAPLRHINGFSQALLEDYADKLDEMGQLYLNEVRGASQEMAQLIDDVLQLARVTRSEMSSVEVNLSDMARRVVSDLQKADEGRAIDVKIQDGLRARGDRRLLQIVLTNLLGNAWKFTSRQNAAEIYFGEAQQNGENCYFVRDNGAGFDMAFAGKLFGAFQRLHSSGEFEGTGIGLATVQRIINRHGGRVWAEGAVNEGATFFFTLPSYKEQGDEKQSDPAG